MKQPLPIDTLQDGLVAACGRVRRIVLRAPTGSGKSTRIPQMLLDLNLVQGQIVVLQPRRIAARLLAARIAQEREVRLGGEVGYQIRFERVESAQTRIKFVTEALLLRQMASDPELKGVGAVVFDEFHERNLHSDVALALARRLQETHRPDLLIMAMSATLDTEAVAKWLGSAETLAADAGNRQRGLGDISRHDDLAAWARLDGAILLFGRQFAVKRKDIDATGLGKIPHRADGAHDFI